MSKSNKKSGKLSAIAAVVQRGAVFDEASVGSLDAAAGRSVKAREPAPTTADALDRAFSFYVTASRFAAHSTDGEAAGFSADLRKKCEAVLATLGATAGSAMVGASVPLDPLTVLAQRPGARSSGPDYALAQYCRRTRDWEEREGALRPSLWGAFRTAVDGIRFLAVVAADAERGYAEAKEKRKKKADGPAQRLIVALTAIYERRFGVRAGTSGPGDSKSGHGPANRFIQAAIKHALIRFPEAFDPDPERDADLLPRLKKLAAGAERIRDRLRDRAAPGGIRRRVARPAARKQPP